MGGTDLSWAPSTWRRLCPLGPWSDPVLDAVEGHLARPSVQSALRRNESDGTYPADVIGDLRTKGVVSLFTEKPLITTYHLCRLNDATARASGSLAISMGVQSLALLPVYIAGDGDQQSRIFELLRDGSVASILLTEWDHGSDLTRIETVATPSDGGFRLEGEKHLINGGVESDLLVTLARTGGVDPESGPFARSGGLSIFLVRRDETVESLPPYRTLPAPAADISGVRFRGTKLDEGSLLGTQGEGFSIVQRTLTLSRGGIASLASGTTAAAWDLCQEYVRSRRIYGGTLLELGAIRDHLLEVAALDALVSALAVKTAAAMNSQGQASGYLTAAAKFACCAMAEAAVDEGRRIFGARGLLEDLPYARLVRDVLLYGVFDGTSHVMLAQLRDHLARVGRGEEESGRDAALQGMRELYGPRPQSLLEMDHRRRRPELRSPRDRARALAVTSGLLDLSPLVHTATAVDELARELGVGGWWAHDQASAYRFAAAVARLEAVFALVELGDGGRREALGMPATNQPLRFGDDLLRYAVATGGLECSSELRRLVGPADPRWTRLVEAEGVWISEREATRTTLHHRLKHALGSE